MTNGSPVRSESSSHERRTLRRGSSSSKSDQMKSEVALPKESPPKGTPGKRSRPRDSIARQVSHDGIVSLSEKENAEKKQAASESGPLTEARCVSEFDKVAFKSKVNSQSIAEEVSPSVPVHHLPNPLHDQGIFSQHEHALRLEAELHSMRLVLSRLMGHLTLNRKGLFNSPVDPVALGLPDYFKIVKKPMDLGTIKNRLHSVEYESSSEVAEDIRLCLRNAMLYNPPHNTVHLTAKELLAFFEDQIEAFYPQLALSVAQAPLAASAPLSVAASGAKLKHPPLLTSQPLAAVDHIALAGPASGQPVGPTSVSSGSLCQATGALSAPTGLSNALCTSSLAQSLSTRKNHPEDLLVTPVTAMVARKRKKRGTKTNLGHNCQWCQGNTCSVCQQGCLALEPTLLICNGVHCVGAKVRKGATYYVAPDGSCQYCQRCHASLTAVLPHSGKFDDDTVCRYKRDLLKRKNDEEVVEHWLTCSKCKSAVHQMCAMHNPYVHDEANYSCPNCREEAPVPSVATDSDGSKCPADRYTFIAGSELPVPISSVASGEFRVGQDVLCADGLSETPVSAFIEQKVREKMLASKCPNAEKTVVVRIISDCQKFFKVPDVVRKHFHMEGKGQDGVSITPPSKVHYQSKAIALFQKIDGLDVCIFCMYVHEYDGSEDEFDSEADKENASQEKRVYIAYLDSVEHFRPRVCRTDVYQEVLTAYLATARRRGFEAAHIWACPPSRGNSFVFWNHPSAQRTPTMERLTAWYHAGLSRAISCGVVTDVKSLYESDFKESLRQIEAKVSSDANCSHQMTCPPLLDGDFWIEEAVRIHGITMSRHAKEKSVPVEDLSSSSNADDLNDPCPAVQVAAMLRDQIIAHPSATMFRRPVNAAALKLKDYHTIISKPMDLGTVHSRCALGEYHTLSDLVADVDLIFSNARKFNPPGHFVHTKAIEVAGIFLAELNQLTKAWLDDSAAVGTEHSWNVFADMSMCLGTALKHFDGLALVEGAFNVENAEAGVNTATLSTTLSLPSDEKSSSSDSSSRMCVEEEVELSPLESGPDAVHRRMVGGDVWLLDKNPVPPKGLGPSKMSKRKKGSSDSIGEPAPKRLRQSWLGEEVGRSVRIMRTSFFKCSLNPESSPVDREAQQCELFAAYTKSFKEDNDVKCRTSRVADARHGLLEFSQFRSLEFDTLRRAKYSSQILLFHMHNDRAPGLFPACTLCQQVIEGVRWHRIGKVIERRAASALPTCGRKPKVPFPSSFVPEELCAACYSNHTHQDQFIPLQTSF